MAGTYPQTLMASVSPFPVARMGGHGSVSLGGALVVSLILHAFCLHIDGITTSISRNDQTPIALNATIARNSGDAGKLVPAVIPPEKAIGRVVSRSGKSRNDVIRANQKEANSVGSTRVYEVGELDVRPALLTWTMPEYPQQVSEHVAAVVVVEFVVDESGGVSNLSILEASGPPDFDQSVRLAFLQAKYTPGYLGSRPVAARIRIKVDFNEPA